VLDICFFGLQGNIIHILHNLTSVKNYKPILLGYFFSNVITFFQYVCLSVCMFVRLSIFAHLENQNNVLILHKVWSYSDDYSASPVKDIVQQDMSWCVCV